MYTSLAVYTISESHEDEAVELFRKLGALTRKEKGNVLYLVHRSTKDPRRFVLYEQYRDKSSFDMHLAADYFTTYVVEGLRKIAESRESEVLELLGR